MDRGTRMNNAQNYANQWDVSAQFFYEKGYYSWMAQRINKFQTVVEVGCGTGYSTLALVENGHKVIAIDKNRDCIADIFLLIVGLLFDDTYLNQPLNYSKHSLSLLNSRELTVLIENSDEYDKHQ